MTDNEWLDGLRGLPDEAILKLHFSLQEKIKKHYKMRDKANNLNKAIEYCKQQIALSPLAISALKRNQAMYNDGEFFAPSHYGYKQYSVILKKKKDLDELDRIKKKMINEGWRIS